MDLLAFIDLEQTYDSVPRHMMWKSLKSAGIIVAIIIDTVSIQGR